MSQLTIDLPTHVPADEARLLLSIKLYADQRISFGKEAKRVALHNYPDLSGVDRAP